MDELKVGDRVRLVRTNDPYTRLRPGSRGTICGISDNPSWGRVLDVDWDDGSGLAMLPHTGDVVARLDPDEAH